MKRLPKLVVFGDPNKGPVVEAIERFSRFVEGKAEIVGSFSVAHDPDKCLPAAGRTDRTQLRALDGSGPVDVDDELLREYDFAIVFGGDGSIISAARLLSSAQIPVVGVNLGKLGFLAEFSIEQLEDCFDTIVAGRTPIERRMMLDCRVYCQARQQFCSAAINDVYITAGPPFRMIELQVSVDGQPLASCVSDGLVVSTPTGSTAYNLSAGGPIVSPEVEAMVITPICPHSLSFRPIVVGSGSVVEITGVRVNEGTTISIDGQLWHKLSADNLVRIRSSELRFLTVSNPAQSRWDTLASKLHLAGKPKYR